LILLTISFYEDGGWRMVAEWLVDSTNKKNWPLAGVILDLLNTSHLTLDLLQHHELIMVKQVKYIAGSCANESKYCNFIYVKFYPIDHMLI